MRIETWKKIGIVAGALAAVFALAGPLGGVAGWGWAIATQPLRDADRAEVEARQLADSLIVQKLTHMDRDIHDNTQYIQGLARALLQPTITRKNAVLDSVATGKTLEER